MQAPATAQLRERACWYCRAVARNPFAMPSDEGMLLQQEEARRQAVEQRARQAALPVQQQATFASTVHAAVLREPGKLNSRRFARKEATRHAAALRSTCSSLLSAGRLLSVIAVANIAHREAPLHRL